MKSTDKDDGLCTWTQPMCIEIYEFWFHGQIKGRSLHIFQINCLISVIESLYQPECAKFEDRWKIDHGGTTDNLISIGSNTIHNILRLPWEPGLVR